MPNSILTTQAVTREALALFLNSNNFIKGIDKQYDSQFAKEGAKIGNTLKIRLPNDYIVSDGPTLAPQSTVENFTTLSITKQKHVDIAFTSAERSLNIQDYKDRYLEPAMNNLAGYVAADVMSMAESVPNFIANFDSTGALTSPVAKNWLRAKAVLDTFGVPRGFKHRMICLDQFTESNTVSSLAGLFNPAGAVSKQYESGEMDRALGFDWMMDQTMITHTTGAYGALPTVNGAGQSGNTLNISAFNGTLNVGDIIQIAGVTMVNRTTKQDTGKPAQFAITQPVINGQTTLSIYPALTGPVGGLAQAYQTVAALPANGAAISVVTPAGVSYKKNLAYNPKAFTAAFADLPEIKNAIDCYRASFGGVSMRMLTVYDATNDRIVTRIDVLYGYTMPRPEWAVAVADVPN